jgi:two-component system cell cycle response regulator
MTSPPDARALLEWNRRLERSLATVEACRSLVRCLDPGEIYAVALDLLLQHLGRERGLAVFKRTSVPMADGVVFRGFEEAEARRLRELLVGEKPVDLDALPGFASVSGAALPAALREAGLDAEALAATARGAEGEAGAFWVFLDGTPFDEADLEQARRIVEDAELALRNAERYNRAKERAFIDDVTEVYNARYLLQATEREIQRAERYEKCLAVLFLDLDRFKLVNDRYGHLVGSRALRDLSRVLQQCIRQVDTLARYGGDEFTILLVDTDLPVAMSVAERIRRTVAETLFEGGRGEPMRLTISIGVSVFPEHCAARDALLDLADKAMYRAKSLGRNCVCSASELRA